MAVRFIMRRVLCMKQIRHSIDIGFAVEHGNRVVGREFNESMVRKWRKQNELRQVPVQNKNKQKGLLYASTLCEHISLVP